MRELKIIQSKASKNENILSPKKSRFLSKRATNILIAFGAKIVTFFKVSRNIWILARKLLLF